MVGNLGHQGRLPEFGVSGRGKSVEEPGIGLALPAWEFGASVADDHAGLDRADAAGETVVRPDGEQVAHQFSGRGCGRKGAFKGVCGKRVCLETGIADLCRPVVRRGGGQRDQVQPGSHAKFGNMEPRAEAGGQVVAVQKDMPGLGQPVLERVIRVVKAPRDGNARAPVESVVALVPVRHLSYTVPQARGEWSRGVNLARIDVTIRGAGIFGLSCAWEMCRRGATVRVIETRGIGAGSSGGLVGALAPHVPERWNPKKAFQFESLVMAEAFWADVAAASERDPGYLRSGRLQPVMDDAGLTRARERGIEAQDLWQGRAVWNVVRAEDFGDWAPRSPTGWVIHDTLSARLHPRQAAAALAEAITRAGGEIQFGDGVEQGALLWATGHEGLTDLGVALGRNVGVPIKGQAALLKLDRAEAPQYLADSVHAIPHCDGTVAIGSTTEREFDDPASTDAQIDAVVARARAACPALADAPVIARWAGLRPRSRSRAPMLGAWPDRPGQYVANGGFKIGFGMAPKVAEVMADLILEGQDAIPDGFRVEDNL